MSEPLECPVCLQKWDREAVIERRAAKTAARRAEIAAQPPRPMRPKTSSTWFGRVDLPSTPPEKGNAA